MTLSGHPLNASGSDSTEELLLTDFTPDSTDLRWFVVNDTVMGGRSGGDFEQDNEQLSFKGRTNTNGGGFSSIRTKSLQLDLSHHAGIELLVKGDGRRYTWRLATNAQWRGKQVSYWADFETLDGTWSTVRIPFSDFIPRYRGTELDGPPLDTNQITGMGLMIYDNQDGPFEVQLASVHAYPETEPYVLKQHQWKHRVLVVAAPGEDDENLIKQLNAVSVSRKKFADRDMVLVTLIDNATSTAGQIKLTIAEADSARAALGIRSGSFALRLIGKDGSVKLSVNTATSMAEIYSLIDSMPMRQSEKAQQ